MTFTIFDLIMRAALLGLIVAPLALLAPGHEAKAFPLFGASESVMCAAVGDDPMNRALLGCPTAVYIPTTSPGTFLQITGPSESVMCAAAGNDRMMRALLGC